MSVSDLPTEVQEMGPIDFVCIEFPHRRAPGAGMQLLLRLVDQGIVRVLDLAFVRKEADGSVRRVAISELGPEVAPFAGASSGMLDDQDIADAGEAISLDSAAALMVYENRWANQDQQQAYEAQQQQQQYAAPPPQQQYAPPPAPAPQPVVVVQSAPTPAAADTGMDAKLAQLQQLGELKAQGILSDAEFEAQKAKILSS